jgi:hypothetical protein
VRERRATRQLVRWDLVAARLVEDAGGAIVIDGAVYLYPASIKRLLLRELRRAYRTFRHDAPTGGAAEFFKRSAMLFHRLWLQHVVARPLPTVVTGEGDRLMFGKAIFDVRDRDALVAALGGCPDLERQDDGSYAWLEETPEFRRALGRVAVEGRRLVLEVMSKARADRGRQLLEALAGDALRYRITEYEDLARAMERYAARPREAPEVDVPPEVEAQVIGEFYERHYRRWLDEPIPALGGHTPREAAPLARFRSKLIDLLQGLENQAARERLAGRPFYDSAWMWAELGLERPE